MGSKGGSKTEVSQYQMSIHLGLCRGPVDAVTAAYYGEKRYWTGYVDANTTFKIRNTGLFGGDKKEGGVYGDLTVLLGRSDQIVPDWFALKLGRVSGVDCPGFRGITSVVHTGPSPKGKPGFYWAANSPYLKSMWYTVVAIPQMLNVEYARIGVPIPEFTLPYDGMWKYQVVMPEDGGHIGLPAEFIDPNYDDSAWPTGPGGFGSAAPWGSALRVGTYIPGNLNLKGVWLRKTITVTDTSVATSLTLTLYHDNLVGVWWNGNALAIEPTENEYLSIAKVDAGMIVGENVVVMQVIDYPYGSEIFAGLSVANDPNAVVYDANPAHIIYEVLVDEIGVDPSVSIDVASFNSASKVLFDEGLGLSVAWSASTPTQQFIDEIKDHINALTYSDPETGKIVLKLIRDDYDESGLRVLTPDNCTVTTFSRKAWGDTINEMVVTWTNPTNEEEETVTLQDNGNIAEQGEIVSDSKNYYGVRSAALAWKLAARELRVACAPLSSAEIELDRSFWNVKPGDCLKLAWPEYGIDGLVMRVWAVRYGKRGQSKITVSVTEDIFSLPVSAFVQPPSTEWVDTKKRPAPVTTAQVVTLPAFVTAKLAGQPLSTFEYPVAYAGVLAKAPNIDTSSADLMGEGVDMGSNPVWTSRGTINMCGRGVLTSELPGAVISNGVGLSSDGTVAPAVGVVMLIGPANEAKQEWALISESSVAGFKITRGLMDTTPRDWPIGTPVWYVTQDFLIADFTSQFDGANPKYKLLTNTSMGQLSESVAPILTGTLTERLHAPLRPANVKVSGLGFGVLTQYSNADLAVTFARRNRIMEETVVLDWDDPDVTPEVGQTTEIDIVGMDGVTVLKTIPGITGTSATVTISDIAPTLDEDSFANVRLDFYAMRDGIRSIQAHGIRVKYVPVSTAHGYGINYGRYYGGNT